MYPYINLSTLQDNGNLLFHTNTGSEFSDAPFHAFTKSLKRPLDKTLTLVRRSLVLDRGLGQGFWTGDLVGGLGTAQYINIILCSSVIDFLNFSTLGKKGKTRKICFLVPVVYRWMLPPAAACFVALTW